MNSPPSSANRTSYVERFIEKYPRLSTALGFLLILIALGLAARDDPESEQIAAQQNVDIQTWEQGYEQGKQAELALRQQPSRPRE